jgi:hypothetical protein
MYIQGVFYIGLAALLIMKFNLDTDSFSVLFGKHINLVRRAAPGHHDIGLSFPPVTAQNLGEELLKRKPGRTEREECALH